MKCDFSGYVTRNDLRCTDGRVIRKNAFADNNGNVVPLVWQHDHSDPENILGNVKLENRPDGVYGYGTFNDSARALAAREAVRHGDIESMSIYANHVRQDDMGNVSHGNIKEVSLVLSGANPGAFIDQVSLVHGDRVDHLDDEAIIYVGDPFSHSDDDADEEPSVEPEPDDDQDVAHADGDDSSESSSDDAKSDETVADVWDTFTDEQKNVVYAMIGAVLSGDSGKTIEQADADDTDESDDDTDGKTIGDVWDSLNEKQKNVAYALIASALEDDQDEGESDSDESGQNDNTEAAQSAEDEGDTIMHNAFEQNSAAPSGVDEFLHSDEMAAVFADARRGGRLSEAVIAHAQNYGIENIDMLFPDARAIRNTPDFYKRRTEWVNTVLNGTSHVPWSRIKSAYADLTEDEARAKGFTLDRNNNKRKMDEIISVAKRETTPQTIYKKQRLDRDDILDITDFDVVAWMKQEMRIMLDEEVARAILVGDGRSAGAEDKIRETNVRPIAFDDEMYTIPVTLPKSYTTSQLIDLVTTSLVDYEGSGSPTLFAEPSFIASMMVDRDQIGHRQYRNRAELADALGVTSIIDVPVMKGAKDSDGNELKALIVNLRDYTVGSDRGGQVSMFDDFDLDYNQQKYLMETRVSGALTRLKSAIAVFAPKSE